MLRDLCFEIIQKCPNNCIFCSSNSSINCTEIIEFEVFKKVIDSFMEKGGIKEISLSGGEPLLHPNIIKMVEYCKDNDIYVTIFTSGIILKNHYDKVDKLTIPEKKVIDMMNKQECDYISKSTLLELKQKGLDKIVFDLQSSSVDRYNFIMGTKNNLANVLKSILNSKLCGLFTEIHFIPLKTNTKQIFDILEIAELTEIDRVSILRFVPQGRGKTNKEELLLPSEDLKKFVLLLNQQKIYKGDIRLGIPMQANSTHLCTAGYDKLSIRYDGAVLPCPAFKDVSINKLKNIYTDLQEIKITSGCRKKPLCLSMHK